MNLTEVQAEESASEPILEPELSIVDPHLHQWPTGSFIPYDSSAVSADLERGHNIEATVFVECSASYRTGGEPALRPVGETEFVVAEHPPTSSIRIAAGIVGWVDLTHPETVGQVLDAHLEVGGDRFCGLRDIVAWRPDDTHAGGRPVIPHVMTTEAYRQSLREVSARHLTFDVWLFHDQLPELCGVLDEMPDLRVVVDHLGGPVARAGTTDAFDDWRGDLAEVAKRPNVVLKVGGLGMPASRTLPVTTGRPESMAVAAAWRPYIETAVELFGSNRCMFESNFPIDKQTVSYDALWNSFKIITSGWSPDERLELFEATARQTYTLPGIRN